MGDRNNPIKFGPEWLRNLPREQSASRTNVGQSAARPSTAGSGRRTAGHGASGTLPAPSVPPEGATGPPVPSTSFGASKGNTTTKPVLKVRLAKLRYGREEMLALYDRNTEAPEELKYFDLLYQPRGKPPFALNTFEQEVRDLRGPALCAMDRFGSSRGPGRGASGESRRGPRGSYVRHSTGQSSGRGPNSMYTSNMRSSYGSGADDEPTRDRSWSANNSGPPPHRNESGEWTGHKTYRRRQNHTNWRQSSRDSGDEWRHSDGHGRSHGRSNSDKWADREWSEGDRRPANDRPQPWSFTRWAWVGGDSHHHNTEDTNLPEWAVDSAEAGAGSFDSSGAFHGYSNDDSNIPKTQESKYPLTRSQTDSTCARSKVPGEGSAEWWASEKAKKLSPRRFDVAGVKVKKPTSTITKEPKPSTATEPSQDEGRANTKGPSDEEEKVSNTEQTENTSSNEDTQQSVLRQNFSESETFDARTRSDIIPFAEPSEEARGNFQSVMINPNNGLRQKHQNIVTSMDSPRPQGNIFQRLHSGMPLRSPPENNDPLQLIEDKIVEDMVEMTLNDTTVQPSVPPPQPAAAPAPAVPTVSAMHGLQVAMPNSVGLQPPVGPQLVAQTPTMQTVGMQNQALNSGLGLPIGTAPQSNIMMPMRGSLPPSMQTVQNNSMGSDQMRYRALLGSYQPRGPLNVVPPPNMSNNSLFMNPPPMQPATEMQLPGREAPAGMFPRMGAQHPTMEDTMESLYSNMMPQMQSAGVVHPANLWYYEDPLNEIQGPFTSKEMQNWYKAGFFSPTLMVRRAFETIMRPLASYGPLAFVYYVDLQPYRMSAYQPPTQSARDLLEQQRRASIDVMQNNHVNPNMAPRFPPPQAQQNPLRLMDALWGQPSTSQDSIWINEIPTSDREEDSVNNLPMCFWDPQPSSTTMTMPLVKDMKTEDEILAQLRTAQTVPTPAVAPFWNDSAPNTSSNSTTVSSSDDTLSIVTIPDLEKLQQLIESERLLRRDLKSDSEESDTKSEKADRIEPTDEAEVAKTQPAQNYIPSEPKLTKQVKNDTVKPAKVKDNGINKAKTKKTKEEKKEDAEIKNREEIKSEKASVETSSSKTKKEEKQSKKELEKEKKALIKDGFTMVKGTEKSVNKELKKKMEDFKIVEDMEKKRKEAEKIFLEEEKKRKQLLLSKKHQEEQQRLLTESMLRRAPWSAGSLGPATGRSGLPLSEIQRLEREKKLEQVKEQQHMMHLIAQQQAAALAREQEMQANLAWAKNHLENNGAGPTLAEIQAETRRQAAASALAAQSIEEVIPLPPLHTSLGPPPVPWGISSSAENGGLRREIIPRPAVPKAVSLPPATTDHSITSGFWDTQPCVSKPEKPQEPPKPSVIKNKKKVTMSINPRRELSPNTEFELWCNAVLALWRAKIDVPTFVGFLKDIESPYEVKDYVKCYLGDSRDSNDFAREFLEKRSKLLRVGTVTPSDDLCSPALAVNPRAALSEYQEVKGKGKKSKKNKMLKVDARILGFSVTAAEDRINVGDIDTA